MANCIRLTPAEYETLQAKATRSKRVSPDAKKRACDASQPSEVKPCEENVRSAPSGENRTISAYQPHPAEVPPTKQRKTGDMTQTERRYLDEILDGKARFEPVSLKLLGGSRYTPDFMTREDGVTVFHEVKGGYHLQSHNRAQTAFREASAQYPWCRFVWAEYKNHTWNIQAIREVT